MSRDSKKWLHKYKCLTISHLSPRKSLNYRKYDGFSVVLTECDASLCACSILKKPFASQSSLEQRNDFAVRSSLSLPVPLQPKQR